MTQTITPEPKTLQSDIIKRVMGSEEKYQAFLGHYRQMRKRNRVNRAEFLSKPLTEKENEVMYAYLNETDEPISGIADKFGMKKSSAYVNALRICARYLYQHREKIV